MAEKKEKKEEEEGRMVRLLLEKAKGEAVEEAG